MDGSSNTPRPADYFSRESTMGCHALRLHPGQEMKASLASFMEKRRIKAGSVVSCVGSLRDVVLQLAGGYDHKLSSASSPEEWEQQQLQQEGLIGREQHVLRTAPRARFEVLSLSGTLSPDGIRVSVCLGDEQGAVCGGHLVSAVVDTSVELVIGHAPKLVFSRRRDSATGFKELVVSRNGMSLCEALLVTFVIMILCYLVMAALLISFGS